MTNREDRRRWLRQLCTNNELADVSVCDAYILGIFDSLARWGPAPRCMPARRYGSAGPERIQGQHAVGDRLGHPPTPVSIQLRRQAGRQNRWALPPVARRECAAAPIDTS